MTLFQRDQENIELGRQQGREEGEEQVIKIMKLYTSGQSIEGITDKLALDKEFVQKVIDKFEIL